MTAPKPMAGYRVLTIEQFGAAPYGSMFLADMGADVIKIESALTGGDAARHTGPFLLGDADSLYFQGWNANKRSVSLDLKSDHGKAVLARLVLTADAVINNLRGDLPASLGLDYATLGKLNPKVVCLHISAYGRDNDRAARPGYDFLMQAEAGLMSLTGDPANSPARFGPSIIDYMTGMVGVTGLLGMMLKAQNTGVGGDVDTCLFDVALHQLNYSATWYLNAGFVANRQPRSAHFSVTPVQTFPTADGWVYVMCMTQKFWLALIGKLGRDELASDPRFTTPAARTENRQALSDVLDQEFRRHSSDHWMERLSMVLPIAPVRTLDEALESEFVARTGMISDVPHPMDPNFRLLANPLKFDGQRPAQVSCSALGADTDAIVAELGLARSGAPV